MAMCLRPNLDGKSLTMLIRALAMSRTDYYNAIYMGLPLRSIQILHQVQNTAARLVSGTSKMWSYITCSGAFPLAACMLPGQIQVLILTLQVLSGLLEPCYLPECLSFRMTTCPAYTSYNGMLQMATPREAWKSTTQNQAFSVMAALLWLFPNWGTTDPFPLWLPENNSKHSYSDRPFIAIHWTNICLWSPLFCEFWNNHLLLSFASFYSGWGRGGSAG